MTRPVKIDLADGPCPVCEEIEQRHQAADKAERIYAEDHGIPPVLGRRCADCARVIPVYKNMGGAGYESATVHYHLGDLLGKQTWLGVNRELCRDCYLADYAVKYPEASPPELGQNEVAEPVAA